MARSNWTDNLRFFIILLVVAHHAAMAYATWGYFNEDAYILSTHPVVDDARWKGFDVFIAFNDMFFMPLMFLLSGVFAEQSLLRKGRARFLRDRFFRLFVPFIIGVTLLMLLAYYPAYYFAHGVHDIKAYIKDYFTVEAWPVGPPWFLWVLFLFNVVYALSYPVFKISLPQRGVCWSWALFTVVLYVPLTLIIPPGYWSGIGPFDLQVSRVLLYFGYFLLGAAVAKVLEENGTFVRRWPLWAFGAVAVFVVMNVFSFNDILQRCLWSLGCAFCCMALLTVFRRVVTARWNVSENAYGIYLLHYIFVVWCQALLLNFDLPAFWKFEITLITAVGGSLLITYLLRRNGLVRKYL